MVKRPSWLGGKKDGVTTYESDDIQRRMKVEAGMTELKVEEQLRNRVAFTDEAIVSEVQWIEKRIQRLEEKKGLTPDEQRKLDSLEKQRTLWNTYRQFKKASMPFGLSGRNGRMNDKFEAIEMLFFSSLDDEASFPLVMMALQKNIDDCYMEEWHVKPAPTIIIQTPVQHTYGGSLPPEGTEDLTPQKKEGKE